MTIPTWKNGLSHVIDTETTGLKADQMTFLDSGTGERSESRPATGAPSGAPATQRAVKS